MKTSTEWLFEKLWETPPDKLTWYALLAQAKEMEKKQIRKAYLADAYNSEYGFAQYYNETYKNK